MNWEGWGVGALVGVILGRLAYRRIRRGQRSRIFTNARGEAVASDVTVLSGADVIQALKRSGA